MYALSLCVRLSRSGSNIGREMGGKIVVHLCGCSWGNVEIRDAHFDVINQDHVSRRRLQTGRQGAL